MKTVTCHKCKHEVEKKRAVRVGHIGIFKGVIENCVRDFWYAEDCRPPYDVFAYEEGQLNRFYTRDKAGLVLVYCAADACIRPANYLNSAGVMQCAWCYHGLDIKDKVKHDSRGNIILYKHDFHHWERIHA